MADRHPPPDHYFSPEPAVATRPREVTVQLPDQTIVLHTDRGVFSVAGLDPGTEVLLRGVPAPPAAANFPRPRLRPRGGGDRHRPPRPRSPGHRGGRQQPGAGAHPRQCRRQRGRQRRGLPARGCRRQPPLRGDLQQSADPRGSPAAPGSAHQLARPPRAGWPRLPGGPAPPRSGTRSRNGCAARASTLRASAPNAAIGSSTYGAPGRGCMMADHARHDHHRH